MNTTETITLCLLGDDQERSYPVAYRGIADIPDYGGEVPVALVTDSGREHLIAQHPDYGWCSVGQETFCRDFQPRVDQDRLKRAL